MIQVSPKAVSRIRQILQEHPGEAGLRLGVMGGGCSGLSYKFGLGSAPKPNDTVLAYDDVKVFVDPKSYTYLDGLTLDYAESLMESGFVFHNPNVKKSCSCGKSFLI